MKKLQFIKILLGVFCMCLSTLSLAIELTKGDSIQLSVDDSIATIFVSAPNVADYQVINSTHFVVYAKDEGSAKVSVFNDAGNIIFTRTITVVTDYKPLLAIIKNEFPDSAIRLQSYNERIVVSGTVATEQDKDSIYMMVGELLGLGVKTETLESLDTEGEEEGLELRFMERNRYKELVDRLRVSVTKQVNVKMTIAEVSRTYLEELGINIGEQLSGSLSTGYFLNQISNFTSSDIYAEIQANGKNTDSQILAQPNLTVLSGETASFLLGGEYPYVVQTSDEASVEFKEWGVSLHLAAKVLNDQQIRLNVAPKVSYIQKDVFGSDYPTLESRSVQTTIELGDGQSFVLAGLIKEQDKEALSQIPYLGDIPVLGALFRNSSTEREQTELVIVATVNLVQPTQEEMIQIPTIQRTSTLSRFFNLPQRDEKQNISSKKLEDILFSGGFKQ